LLAAATLLTYWPVVHCEFITYDDPQYVTENPTVRAGLSARGVAWAFRSAHAANWHPLTWLSHMLDCQLYGLRPFGHHLTNLLFHTANAPLLFLVLGRLTGAQWRSAFVAAMFALHPTHVESVAWISERKDLLSTCFGLLSLWAYAGYIMSVEGRGSQGKSEIGNPKSGALPKSETRTAKPQVHGSGSNSDKSRAGVQGSGLVCSISHFRTSTCYLLSLLLFALSLMSKPMLVTLPFVMLLLDYWPLGRVRIESLLPLIREKLPFVGLGVGSSVITVFVQQRGEALATFEHLPVAVRLCHVPVAYLLYLLKAVWPARLAVFYPLPPECAAGQAAAAGLLLAGVSVGAVLGRSRGYLFLGWFWFLGMLVPVIGLVQAGSQAMADRYTYLPFVGLFIGLAWGTSQAATRWQLPRRVLAFAGSGLVLCCALLTRQQLQVWQNTETLFGHALLVTKGSSVAYDNLGLYLWQHGRNEEAIENYRKSLKLRRRFEPLNNLALALASQGKHSEAIAYYEAALQIRPAETGVHKNLANALAQTAKLDNAAEHYLIVLEANPRDLEARADLAMTLAKAGRTAEAASQFELLLRTQPGDLGARNNLGICLTLQGRIEDAIEQFRQVLHADTNNLSAHGNLAEALTRQRRFAEAVEHYRAVLRLNPQDATAQEGLSRALAELGHQQAK
jgi:tetratricopeptide (TPR) repeat protein